MVLGELIAGGGGVESEGGFLRVRHEENPCRSIFWMENFALALLIRFDGSFVVEFDSPSNDDDSVE